ncbi:16S rRNA (uracil(1498)-N(3))-methyltransferase [Ethanoligenens sp.]|uniref:16S rRNA (uracil(1498)-N(3))-methyltransferase n=1 Tax=Ethanoligenens sp. TaxID=2099655 RepID=UPI0039EC8A43
MPRFFTQEVDAATARITGPDAVHIARVLRMRPGEQITVCDLAGSDYLCEILSAKSDAVDLRVLEQRPTVAEPTVHVTLFQGLPKADKMELIVQKSVELGVSRIVPVLTARCVSRPDKAVMAKKTERWRKIALEAAKQSGRGKLPRVDDTMGFTEAVQELGQMERGILFYEKGGDTHRDLWSGAREIGVCIGPEGGFADEEVALAVRAGAHICTLGPRILRTETAPLCVLSVVMYATGNL